MKVFGKATRGVVALTLILFVMVSATCSSFADESKQYELARELIGRLRFTELLEAMIPGIMKAQAPLIKKADPAVDDEELNELSNIMLDEFRIHQNDLHEKIAMLYASRFSESELSELNRFYSTPAGKKLLLLQPELVREGMQAGQQFVVSIMPAIQNRFRAFLRKKRGKKN